MPRVSPLAPDPDESRKRATAAWIVAGAALKNITIEELAERTGIAPSTLRVRIRKPGTLRNSESWLIQREVGSPQEVAAALINY